MPNDLRTANTRKSTIYDLNSVTWASTQPLDPVYGAGMLDVYQSWLELNAGQRTALTSSGSNSSLQPPGNLLPSTGWDLVSLAGSNSTNHYFFSAPAAGAATDTLTATIDWSVMNWSGTSNPPPIFNNLDLALYNVTTNTPALVSFSGSTVDNLEHLYFQGLVPGNKYDLRVYQASSPVSGSTTYGLAYSVIPSLSLWATNINGNWSDLGNWTGGAPNAAGAKAVINASTTVALAITLDSPQTVGTLQFGNSGSKSVGYTLTGSGSNKLTLNNSGGTATISVTDGTHAIAAPVVLASNLVVTSTSSNPWTLSFGPASSITDNGNHLSLTLNAGKGTLILSGSDTYTGGTIVSAGTLILTSRNAIADGTSLTVGAGAASIFNSSISGAPAVASTISPVPEPGTLTLLVVGTAGLLGYAWRRRRERN